MTTNDKALQKSGVTTVASYLNQDSVKKYLKKMLDERTGQFITSLVSLANVTQGLASCSPKTLMFCGLKAASLNLPLDNNLGFAYAIPYKNHKTGVVDAQFQLGYRAFIQLAQRTGQYKMINVIDIRQGEIEVWHPFTEELQLIMIEDIEKRNNLPVVGYAAVFELVNGFRKTSYWTRARIEAHGKRFSKTYNKGPWQTDFDAMAKKTVLKDLLSKWGPLSVEMQEAVKFDQAVIRKDNATGEEVPDYVDAEFTFDDSFDADSIDDELEKEFKEAKESKGQKKQGEGEGNGNELNQRNILQPRGK